VVGGRSRSAVVILTSPNSRRRGWLW
jgi:hypothetical protein